MIPPFIVLHWKGSDAPVCLQIARIISVRTLKEGEGTRIEWMGDSMSAREGFEEILSLLAGITTILRAEEQLK